jgi:hypothetical protein
MKVRSFYEAIRVDTHLQILEDIEKPSLVFLYEKTFI